MQKKIVAVICACILAATCCSCNKKVTRGDISSTDDSSAFTVSDASNVYIGDESVLSVESGDLGDSSDSTGNAPVAQGNSTKATSAGKSDGDSTKTITWWMTDPGAKAAKYLSSAIEAYQNKTGVTVDLYLQSESGGNLTPFDSKFIPAMSVGNQPDICMFNTLNPKYAVDITQYLDSNYLSQFFSSVVDRLKINGRFYSTPAFMSVNGLLLYSKVDFKNAGLDPDSPPATIAQLDNMASQLYKTDASGNYNVIGYYPWYWLMLEFPSLMFKPFGGTLVNADGYPTINMQENVDALNWVKSYVDKYGYDKVNNSLSKMTTKDNDYGHALAMMMSFSAQINSMAEGKKSSAEWGITVFPGVDSSKNGLALGLNSGYSVVQGTAHEKECVEFIKYLSQEYALDYVVKNYKEYGSYSCNQKAWEQNLDSMDGFTQMLYKQVLSKATVNDFGDMGAKKYSTPATYTTLIKNSVKKIIEGKAEVKAELDSLQRKVEAQTTENK